MVIDEKVLLCDGVFPYGIMRSTWLFRVEWVTTNPTGQVTPRDRVLEAPGRAH